MSIYFLLNSVDVQHRGTITLLLDTEGDMIEPKYQEESFILASSSQSLVVLRTTSVSRHSIGIDLFEV